MAIGTVRLSLSWTQPKICGTQASYFPYNIPSSDSNALFAPGLTGLGFSAVGFNPTALRKAKIVYNLGLSECNKG